MTLYHLISQLKLSDSEVEIFAEGLSKRLSLRKLCQSLGDKITEKQAFALAKVYCPEALGEDLESVAPGLIDDRDKLLRKERETLKAEKEHRETFKILSLIEEDLSFLILERAGRMPASD